MIRRRMCDEKAHGEYRTKRVILEIYDAMAGASRTAAPTRPTSIPCPPTPASRWNVRELARQIEASAFERSVLGPPKLSTALREIHPGAADETGARAGYAVAVPKWATILSLKNATVPLGPQLLDAGEAAVIQLA